jgi:hypothetical protein
MSLHEREGEFFLPNGKKYPGQLTTDPDTQTIVLEVFSNEFIEGTEINFTKNHPIHSHPIILGDARGKVTLHHCQWRGCKGIGKNLYKTSYHVQFAFWGVHFDKDSTIPIREATFIFPHLSTWYDGELFHSKLEGKEGLFVNGKEVIENILTKDDIKINDELTLHLFDEVRKRIEDLDISYIVRFQKYARFKYSHDVPFKRLIKDAMQFLKLLEFCFARPQGCQIIYVDVDRTLLAKEDQSPPMFKSLLERIRVTNYSLRRKKEIPHHSSHGHSMLISRWKSPQQDVNQAIISWFNNDRFRTIYEYYIDSNDWMQGTEAILSNVMFNNRFLNLIQGLEDYYRAVLESSQNPETKEKFEERKQAVLSRISDASLKKWVNDTLVYKEKQYATLEQKLSAIITHLSTDLSILFKDISLAEFPASSTRFRHELSHGLNKEVFQGNALHHDYYIAQLLLGTCILRTLGVSNIKKLIAYNMKFQDAVANIKPLQQQKVTD